MILLIERGRCRCPSAEDKRARIDLVWETVEEAAQRAETIFDIHERDVLCPTCGALPGIPCRTRNNWQWTDTHSPRLKARGRARDLFAEMLSETQATDLFNCHTCSLLRGNRFDNSFHCGYVSHEDTRHTDCSCIAARNKWRSEHCKASGLPAKLTPPCPVWLP